MIQRLQPHLNKIVLGFLILVAVFGTLGSILTNPDGMDGVWWSGLLQNFSTEVMGAIMTFVLFELVINGQQRIAENEEQRKRDQLQAISELKRADTPEARKPIIDRMQAGNLLKGVDLREENLEGVKFGSANLEGANLAYVNLMEADLVDANLTGAYLGKANLEGADLQYTNLEGANLREANLKRAYLGKANLKGAYLGKANLDNVTWELNFPKNYTTTLPDGTLWTLDTDMFRFTNPDHQDYQSTLEKINTLRAEKGFDPIDHRLS